MHYCNTCRSHNCSCTTNSCIDNCGNLEQINAKSVFYRGNTQSCVPITTGQTLETILKNIDAKICSINPSGNISIVQGTATQIVVTDSTIGDTTTYTVSLDSDITDFISDTNATLANLQACCNSSVKSIVTDDPSTLDISDDGSGNYTLNVIPPSGQIIYDGIIENNVSINKTNGLGGVQILKSFTYNYVAGSNLSINDEIRFKVNGTLEAVGGVSDEIILEFYDSINSVSLGTTTFSGFNTIGTTNYTLDGVVFNDGISVNNATYDLGMVVTSGNIGTLNIVGVTFQKLSATLTGTPDFTGFTIRVKYNNLSTSSSNDNSVRKLMVEVRKKI